MVVQVFPTVITTLCFLSSKNDLMCSCLLTPLEAFLTRITMKEICPEELLFSGLPQLFLYLSLSRSCSTVGFLGSVTGVLREAPFFRKASSCDVFLRFARLTYTRPFVQRVLRMALKASLWDCLFSNALL